MDRDERSNGEAVDLRPLVGLLHDLPPALVERLTVKAIKDHRALVERAEDLFNTLPSDAEAGESVCDDAHFAYLDASITMHAQMSALTTLLHILGYTPSV